MNYELAKQLKDAGFPYPPAHDYGHKYCLVHGCESDCHFPTLSELIEACDMAFLELEHSSGIHSMRTKDTLYWEARGYKNGSVVFEGGKTPDEAVARLWLALQGNKITGQLQHESENQQS